MFVLLFFFCGCRCPEGFYGLRCQSTADEDADGGVEATPAGHGDGDGGGGGGSVSATVTAVVVVLVVLVVLAAAAAAGVAVARKRRRGKPFMHVRMQSQENVEISNPMYLREDADDDVEPGEPSLGLTTATKVTNQTGTPTGIFSLPMVL